MQGRVIDFPVSSITLLQNATVLDVQSGSLLPHRRVVVQNGRIERLEPMQAEVLDAGAAGLTALDLSGQTCCPD